MKITKIRKGREEKGERGTGKRTFGLTIFEPLSAKTDVDAIENR